MKIGFTTDISSAYSDIDGENGAVSIQMAIDDCGGKVLGRPIKLLSANHQNKADAEPPRQEMGDTQQVTAPFSAPNSSVGLSVNNIARDK